MAMQEWKGGVPYPMYPTAAANAAASLQAVLLDAANEKAANIFAATAAKAIRTVHVHTGTVTTGDTVDVRVETVDSASAGTPTGTLWGTNTNGALVIADGDDNAWKSVQLTADTAALALGDVFALVVVNGSAPGNLNIQTYLRGLTGFPYATHFTTFWLKLSSTNGALIVPQYSDGTFEPVFGFTDVGGPITATTFNSGSTTNRRGNIFQVPTTCRAKGCWVYVDADGDYTVKLYDSDGSTVLATTATINRFQRTGTAGALHFHPFTTTATLSASTNYRWALVPSSVTNLTTYDWDGPTAAYLDMFPGGQSMHRSLFTSSAWVETTTARTLGGVILDGFGDDAGGGGSPIFVITD